MEKRRISKTGTIIPQPEEWLAVLGGVIYVYDPWEADYFPLVEGKGLYTLTGKASRLISGKEYGGNYCRELLKFIKKIQENPELIGDPLPEKPKIKKRQKKKGVKKGTKRGPYRSKKVRLSERERKMLQNERQREYRARKKQAEFERKQGLL